MTDRLTTEQVEATISALATEIDLIELGNEAGPETLRQALTTMRQLQRGWIGIESAPRDETEIDVWVDGEFPRRVTNVSWREPSHSEWWVHGGDTIETPDPTWHDCFGPLGKDEQPTAWMPLPTPPEAGQ